MPRLRPSLGFLAAMSPLLATCSPQTGIPPTPPATVAPLPAATPIHLVPTRAPETSTPVSFLIGEIWYWNPGRVDAEFGRLPEGTYERLACPIPDRC